MSFSQTTALGFFLVDDLLAAGAAIKGIQAIASSAGTIIDPGKSMDQKREAREAFFRNSAIAGSVTAGRYELGGLQETASHEKPFYQSGWQAIAQQNPDVAAEAAAQGAKWVPGDTGPDSPQTQQMIADVQRDIKALGLVATPAPGAGAYVPPLTFPTTTAVTRPTATGVATMPTMYSTAPFNYMPWLLGGIAAVVVLPPLLRKHA